MTDDVHDRSTASGVPEFLWVSRPLHVGRSGHGSSDRGRESPRQCRGRREAADGTVFAVAYPTPSLEVTHDSGINM
jgi:hypothetical protein